MKTITWAVGILTLLFLQSTQLSTKKERVLLKKMTKEFAYIPSGNVFMEEKIVSVQSFYMLKTEVTNAQYAEFLSDLSQKGEFEKLKIAQIDTLKWNTKNSMNVAYSTYYHKHPAYQNYPVVNVSYEAALLYCEWLSAKYSETYGSSKFFFRLPTKEEFIRAGRGDNKDVQYAWGNSLLRNNDGQVQCNFLQVGSESIHRDVESGEFKIIPAYESVAYGNYDVMAPAKSYWANPFGIYNLNGNAAEMINLKGTTMGGSWKNTGYDVRLESLSTYTEANPSTGFRVVMTYLQSMF